MRKLSKNTQIVIFHVPYADRFEDGEQCIEIDYANGQMDIKISEDAYEEWDDEDEEEYDDEYDNDEE